MIFNNFDRRLNEEIAGKARLNKAEKKYLELLNMFDEDIINQAKAVLRGVVVSCMNREWIHVHAQSR
jgi:vacuolar-type H+-ATPase subunit B/Vma2